MTGSPRRALPPPPPAADAGAIASAPKRLARRAQRPIWRWLIGALAVTVVVVLWLTRSAWSQWLASGPVDSVVLVTGDLSISPGAVSWTVADQGLSGDSWQSLAPVTLGVGQQVVISQVLGTDFEGENLNVALTVNLTDQSPAVSGTWRALTSQGALFPGETAPVVIGQAVNLYNVDGADLSGMVIELTLTQQADPTWVDPQTVVSATPDTLALMVIDAQQVRCGDGFTTACPQGVGS